MSLYADDRSEAVEVRMLMRAGGSENCGPISMGHQPWELFSGYVCMTPCMMSISIMNNLQAQVLCWLGVWLLVDCGIIDKMLSLYNCDGQVARSGSPSDGPCGSSLAAVCCVSMVRQPATCEVVRIARCALPTRLISQRLRGAS